MLAYKIMPTTKSAQKALLQNKKRRIENRNSIKKSRGLVKKVNLLIGKKEKEEAKKMIPEIYKALDKAAKKGVIKKKNASRKKSRLTKAIQKLESGN